MFEFGLMEKKKNHVLSRLVILRFSKEMLGLCTNLEFFLRLWMMIFMIFKVKQSI